MKTQGFLDQLLKTAQNTLGGSGGGLGDLLGGGNPLARSEPRHDERRRGDDKRSEEKRGLLNADFGKGALTGGALGLLLGNKKLRKHAGKFALAGGVAAVGVLAYKAYGDYKRQQEGPGAAEPRTVDRLPPPQAEQHSRAILQALVAASKADRHLHARQREAIEGEFVRIDGDTQLRSWLHSELEKPLDPAEVARAAETPEIAAEMYLASLLAADEQNYMERAYLDELARQLKIDDALKTRLEQQLRDAQQG